MNSSVRSVMRPHRSLNGIGTIRGTMSDGRRDCRQSIEGLLFINLTGSLWLRHTRPSNNDVAWCHQP